MIPDSTDLESAQTGHIHLTAEPGRIYVVPLRASKVKTLPILYLSQEHCDQKVRLPPLHHFQITRRSVESKRKTVWGESGDESG